MDYISVQEFAEKCGVSGRRIQKLCSENRIDGVIKFGNSWLIPKLAEKPVDKRLKASSSKECE